MALLGFFVFVFPSSSVFRADTDGGTLNGERAWGEWGGDMGVGWGGGGMREVKGQASLVTYLGGRTQRTCGPHSAMGIGTDMAAFLPGHSAATARIPLRWLQQGSHNPLCAPALKTPI